MRTRLLNSGLLATVCCVGGLWARAGYQIPWIGTPSKLSLGAGADSGRSQRFAREVDSLRRELRIPGAAVAVFDDRGPAFERGLGYAVLDRSPVTHSTLFPVASLTKTMVAMRVLQLVEQGKLSLDDRVAVSPATTALDPPTAVRNLISHTSDPPAGTRFLYSGARFNDLTAIIETAGGAPLGRQLTTDVFAKAGMGSTYANLTDIPDSVRATRLAHPYSIVRGEIAPGAYPSGPTRAATGVVSDLDDLVTYAVAVVSGRLVSMRSLEAMFTPANLRSGARAPYGLGWFVTTYDGEKVVWGYGQETSFSSLLMYVPARHVGAILLANSAALSDPFWLIFGNLRHSPFAEAFLHDVAFPEDRLDTKTGELDAGLAHAWLGDDAGATLHLERALLPLPGSAKEDAGVLATLARSRDPQLLATGEEIATRMLAQDPGNVRTQFDYAVLLQRTGPTDRALRRLRALAAHPNSSLPWIAPEAAVMIRELGQ